MYLLLSMLAALVVLLPADVCADPSVGRFVRIDGRINIERPGNGTVVPGISGGEVFAGDVIVTDKDSRAQIAFIDNSFAYIAPGSKVMVMQYYINKTYTGEDRRKAFINLLEGMVRTIVRKYTGEGSVFIVETPTASARTQNADFIISFSRSVTGLSVLEGDVAVRNLSSYVIGEVLLRPNQTSVIKENLPPSQPDTLIPAQRKEYLRDTMGYKTEQTQKGVK